MLADFGNNRVRVVAGTTGTFYGQAMTAGDIYTVAGDGSSAFSGDKGPATSAGLGAAGVAVDASGNLVIADALNQRVRVVAESTATFYGQAMTAGDIYTVAGNGTAGFKDTRPALKGELNEPTAVAVDGSGNLVIADTGNQRVRVVAAGNGTFYNQPMAAGSIYTVAGHGNTGSVGDGASATAAELASPAGLLLDASGNTLIADTANNRIRVLAGTTGTFYGQAMTAGDIYTVAGTGAIGHFGDGGPASIATLDKPQGMAIDPAGNLLIADTHSNRVRVVAESTGTFYGQSMNAGIHLHRGRRRDRGRRQRHPGHQRHPRLRQRRDRGSSGEPGDRHQQAADPRGGRNHRHVLRPVDDRRGHLHGGRQRRDRFRR